MDICVCDCKVNNWTLIHFTLFGVGGRWGGLIWCTVYLVVTSNWSNMSSKHLAKVSFTSMNKKTRHVAVKLDVLNFWTLVLLGELYRPSLLMVKSFFFKFSQFAWLFHDVIQQIVIIMLILFLVTLRTVLMHQCILGRYTANMWCSAECWLQFWNTTVDHLSLWSPYMPILYYFSVLHNLWSTSLLRHNSY